MNRIVSLALAALVLAGCEQAGNTGVTEELRNDLEVEEPEGEPPPVVVGMEIAALPDITYYPRNGGFSAEGLSLVKVYSDGGTEPIAEGFTLKPDPDPLDTSIAGQKLIWVHWGAYKGYFTVYVDNSTVIPTGIEIAAPPKTVYGFGEPFDTGGMAINGVYSDGAKKILPNSAVSAVSIEGYDPYRRGGQQVTLRMNNASAVVGVQVRVGAGDSVTLSNTNGIYSSVFIKGKDFDLANSGLKAVVKKGNISVTLTEGNGGLRPSDITKYNKDAVGKQWLGLTLDDKKLNNGMEAAVVEAEPDVWFDFGYMRHEGDPEGMGPGEGKLYTRPNEALVLAPVRYLIGYNDDHSPASGTTYSWYVDGAKQTAAGETFRFTPSAAGTYTVKVEVTGRGFITGGAIKRDASVQVVCHTGPVPTAKTFTGNGAINGTPSLRNFAPGQFTESGNGYGWSLGSIGGYLVWRVKSHQPSYLIDGNAFGGWNEAGIVWVQEDKNGNGVPDEAWYELKGSDDGDAGKRAQITRRYAVTYVNGSTGGQTNSYGQVIRDGIYWADCKGRAGRIPGGWSGVWGVQGSIATFTGTLLRDDGRIDISVLASYFSKNGNDYSGYVDTVGPSYFYVKDAIDAAGGPVTLSNVRFIKVQTAIFCYGSLFGEISTEIQTATDLGMLSNFPKP